MSEPVFWLVGGPNGAGKTTLVSHPRFRRLLRGVPFLNPDDLTLRKLQAAGRAGFKDTPAGELERYFLESAQEVENEIRARLNRGEAVGVESVLSTEKYRPLVEQSLAGHGFFGFIYVALKNAGLSRERVAGRVALGGHDVPVEKLAARWLKSVANLGWFARRATRFWVVDNSDSTPGVAPKLIGTGGEGRFKIFDAESVPEVTDSLTAAFSGR